RAFALRISTPHQAAFPALRSAPPAVVLEPLQGLIYDPRREPIHPPASIILTLPGRVDSTFDPFPVMVTRISQLATVGTIAGGGGGCAESDHGDHDLSLIIVTKIRACSW